MVVGVHKSLEEGRTYSRAELNDRFGLAGADLDRVVDLLTERGRLKPMIFEAPSCDAQPLRLHASEERHLRWTAIDAQR